MNVFEVTMPIYRLLFSLNCAKNTGETLVEKQSMPAIATWFGGPVRGNCDMTDILGKNGPLVEINSINSLIMQ